MDGRRSHLGRDRRHLRRDGRGPSRRHRLSCRSLIELTEDPEALFRRYLEEIEQHPPLEPDEEVRLGRLAREGDLAAAERLIQGNLQLVVAIARRYVASGWPILDLVQEGNLGLVQAVDGFDPDRGLAFRTFAMWWIRHAISSALQEHGPSGTIRPLTASETLEGRLQEVWDAFVATEGRQPTIADLAERLQISEDRVRQLLGAPPPPAAP